MKRRYLILSAALIACHKSGAKQNQAAPQAQVATVQVVPVTVREVPRYLTLTGSLIANQESELAANAAGLVAQTYVERGTMVRKGQVVARLDLRAAQLGRAEAQANLESAKQQQSLAKLECARAKGLLEHGAMTQQEYDRVASQCATTMASAEAAMARARLAEKTLGDATIRAPFSGLISQRYVSVGEYVQAQTKVAHLLELDPLRLELTVAEQDIGSVKEGLEVEFSVATFPQRTFSGSIRYVGPAVRAQTRDLVVEAVVPNADKALRPGMFATARLKIGESRLPLVPAAALLRGENADRLFVAKGDRLEERIVELGEPQGGEFPVLQGLQPDERIVASANAKLADGQIVQATQANSQPAKR